VAGIFEAGHQQFDSGLAFVNLEDGEALIGLAAPSGLRLRLADLYQAPADRRSGAPAAVRGDEPADPRLQPLGAVDPCAVGRYPPTVA